MNRISKLKFEIYCGIFSFFMFCYILIRAINFSFTDDEASSVLDILNMNFSYFFGSYANTHLINTFFLWIEMKVMGFSELSLRIHSVLSYLLFAYAVYKFACYSTNKYYHYLLPILLTLNPFMIDFFSMARGYSISFAFMMIGLYYFSRYIVIEPSSKRQLYVSFLFSGLSVISCYILLNFYVALLSIYFFYTFLKTPTIFSLKNIGKLFWSEIIFWFTNIFFILAILALLIKIGPLTIAAGWPAKSFWFDSLYSIISHFSIHESSYTIWVYYLFLLFIVVSFLLSLADLIKSKQLKLYSLFSVLFLLIYLSYTFQYHFFNIPFVSKRGIIYLYPIIMLMIFFSFSEIDFSVKLKKIVIGSLLFISGWLMLNFYFNCSIKRGILTPPNDLEAILKLIEVSKGDKDAISIGANASASAPLNYYKIKNGYSWATNIGMGYSKVKGDYLFYGKEPIKTGDYDYFIIDKNEVSTVERFQKIRIIKEFDDSNLIFAIAN